MNADGVGSTSEVPPIRQRIEAKLRAGLKVDHFSSLAESGAQEIEDTSGNCGSSFAIVVVSPDFAKKMTLARHKLVNGLLSEEIAILHAFSQKTYTPEQWAKEKK